MIIAIDITVEENEITLEAWPTIDRGNGREVDFNKDGWYALEQWSVETDTETRWSGDWDNYDKTIQQMTSFLEGVIDALTHEAPPAYDTVRAFLLEAKAEAERHE